MEGDCFAAGLFFRDVAQPGSALVWGTRGRGFKSRRPDEKQRKGKPSGLPFRVSRRVIGIVRRKSPPFRLKKREGRPPGACLLFIGQISVGALVPVILRLEWTVRGHTNVVGLLVRQLIEFDPDLCEM